MRYLKALSKGDIDVPRVKVGKVRIAVVKPHNFCGPLGMTASGKPHCGVATIGQWQELDVFNRR